MLLRRAQALQRGGLRLGFRGQPQLNFTSRPPSPPPSPPPPPLAEVIEDEPAAAVALVEEIRAQAALFGLPGLRVTSADPAGSLALFQEWLDRDMHGEMGFLARPDRLVRRNDLQAVLPGARSVLLAPLAYWPGKGGFPETHLRDLPALGHRRRMQLKRTAKLVGLPGIPETFPAGDETPRLGLWGCCQSAQGCCQLLRVDLRLETFMLFCFTKT